MCAGTTEIRALPPPSTPARPVDPEGARLRTAQLSRAVAWQATALAVLAVVVGLPIGVGAGRWVWAVFAGRLGVPPLPVTPVLQ